MTASGESKTSQRSQPALSLEYPIRCVECGAREVRPARVSHDLKKAHDGRLHALRVANLPVTKCAKCGEIYFGAEADTQISAALRKKIGLLPPEQIRAERQALDLRQKDLADALGTAMETISRWESGGLIQSRAMDNLLRLYFRLPQVREALGAQGRSILAGPSGKGNPKPLPATGVVHSRAARTPCPKAKSSATSGKRPRKTVPAGSVSTLR